MEYFINFQKGCDATDTLGTTDSAFKTFDFGYQKIRGTYPGYTKFNIEGDQEINLLKIGNCDIKGTATLKFKKTGCLLTNCNIENPVIVELQPTSTEEHVFNVNESVKFTGSINVVETALNTYNNYPSKMLFLNNGNLDLTASNMTVNVNRDFTLVNNTSILNSSFPKWSSAGGIIFKATETSKINKVNSDNKVIDVRMLYHYITNSFYLPTKVAPKFNIFNGNGFVLFTGVNLNIAYDGKEMSDMFYILNDKFQINNIYSEFGKVAGKYIDNYNFVFLNNCNIISNKLVNLSNTIKIKLVGTTTTGIKNTENKDNLDIKIIKNDYVICDNDVSKFLIDASTSNIKIVVPPNVKLSGDIYFKKIDKTINSITIDVPNLVESSPQIRLDNRTPILKIFKHEETFYIKYKM
jgi:hypothetical protein